MFCRTMAWPRMWLPQQLTSTSNTVVLSASTGSTKRKELLDSHSNIPMRCTSHESAARQTDAPVSLYYECRYSCPTFAVPTNLCARTLVL